MPKNIAKSIRISDEVFAYIDQTPGKGFNEKLENIILEAKKEEAKRQKHLDELQKSIDKEQRDLYRLMERNRYMEEFFKTVLRMQHQLYDLKELLEKAINEPENKETVNTQ